MAKRAIEPFLDRIHCGDAAEIMARMPDDAVDLVVTSPPYWTAVSYGEDRSDWDSYERYLDDMLLVWTQSERVLRPNGKLCINAPLMPIPKDIVAQHTRHLKNISADLERTILDNTALARMSLFIWQKQTSKMMFGSYPFPGNIIENNTIEMIAVYVKPGKPPKFERGVRNANRLSREEWLDLTQQVWFMYPHDVRRGGQHPAPFPEKLPGRLMRLYTFGASADFPGEIVLDPFAGTGTTCAVARQMGRRWIGIETVQHYAALAQSRVDRAAPPAPMLMVGRAKYPTRAELLASVVASAGRSALNKHKRKTYGRSVKKRDTQLILV